MIYFKGMNQYEMAIQSVVKIIEDYDSDGLMPVLGFGARLPPDGKVSHEFFVNGHPTNPYCERTSGVLEAYKACVSRIQLFGPTNFSPTIRHVSNIAKNFIGGSHYFILLMITDGIITDMEQTKEAIVSAADYPVSIIIVGVGEANFDAMEELDGDDERISTQRGKVASRDIVQFVPLRKFNNVPSYGGQNFASDQVKESLAREVLAEIPDQFLSYMKSKEIEPLTLPSARLYPNINSGGYKSTDDGYSVTVTSNEVYSSDDE